jgi:hypothetical protein
MKDLTTGNHQAQEPVKTGEGQQTQPNRPDTEINPAKPANNTEVDLDTSKTKTYPPERH